MIKLKEVLTTETFLLELEKVDSVPPILYHATFAPLLPSIQEKGLIPGGIEYRNHQWARPGVYMSTDKELAGSFAEDGVHMPAKWLKQIVILSIDTTKLNIKNFYQDPNLSYRPEEWGDPLMPKCYYYKGVVHSSAIVKVEQGSYQW